MAAIKILNGVLTVAGTYKPGDPPPNGYLEWHEWAEVQHKAGLRQVMCGRCGKWRYPQELSGGMDEHEAKSRRGRGVAQRCAVCVDCAGRDK